MENKYLDEKKKKQKTQKIHNRKYKTAFLIYINRFGCYKTGYE